MLYCGLHRTFGGKRSAIVRVQVLEVREEDRKNRKCSRSAPEKVPALRWQSRAIAVRAGDSV